MAKEIFETFGNFDKFIEVVKGIAEDISDTVSLEGEHKFDNTTLLVYESYSYLGGNRMTLTLCIEDNKGKITLVVITSGGSTAMFFKLNTLGENALLGDFYKVLEKTEKIW